MRPALLLMSNEMFGGDYTKALPAALAIEVFHNFSLLHDDIMDKAPLRRGRATVHAKYNESTALLAGDVMLLQCYEYLNETDPHYVKELIRLLNKTGAKVCEGQQLDMDFEKTDSVGLEQYLHMIALKTAVFLAASLRMGSIVAGATEEDQEHVYAFGKNLGLAFQVQDDWLDSFGDPLTFGKQPGGDILANKKTFLLVHALEKATPSQKKAIKELLQNDDKDKVKRMIAIYRETGVDKAAESAKKKYMQSAYHHLDSITVPEARKVSLKQLAEYLLQRET